jgi:hypothetical protein
VGFRAGLNDVETRKFLTLPGLKLRPLGWTPVASRYTDYAIPALNLKEVEIERKMEVCSVSYRLRCTCLHTLWNPLRFEYGCSVRSATFVHLLAAVWKKWERVRGDGR